MSRHAQGLVALLVASVASSAWAAEPIAVTLCDLSSAPHKYEGILIRVHARVMSDALERTVLVDVNPTCRFSGAGFAVAPGVSDPAIDTITNAIFSGRHPGTRNKIIRGGLFWIFLLFGEAAPMREIEIRSLSNLK